MPSRRNGVGIHAVQFCADHDSLLVGFARFIEAALKIGNAVVVGDEITKTSNIDVLCGYVLSNFQYEEESHVYERICAEHSAVYSR